MSLPDDYLVITLDMDEIEQSILELGSNKGPKKPSADVKRPDLIGRVACLAWRKAMGGARCDASVRVCPTSEYGAPLMPRRFGPRRRTLVLAYVQLPVVWFAGWCDSGDFSGLPVYPDSLKDVRLLIPSTARAFLEMPMDVPVTAETAEDYLCLPRPVKK